MNGPLVVQITLIIGTVAVDGAYWNRREDLRGLGHLVLEVALVVGVVQGGELTYTVELSCIFVGLQGLRVGTGVFDSVLEGIHLLELDRCVDLLC